MSDNQLKPVLEPQKTVSPASLPILEAGTKTKPRLGSFKELAKKWGRAVGRNLPFATELDYLRRKALDATVFDFKVKELAKTLETWPKILLIDTTNRCNAKCVWCPNPDLEDLGTMSMELFKRIIDDYATRGGMVHLGTFGEPFMDKTLREKFEHVRRYSSIPRLNVLTNGFFFNDKTIPALLDNRVGVDISLDELDQETFEEVKKMDFEPVRKGILDLLAANESAGDLIPINIRIKTLKTRKDTLENDFYKQLQNHNCKIALTPINDNIISNWAGKFDKEGFFSQYLKIAVHGSRLNHKNFNATNVAPCNQLWKWMVVYWDGNVVLCCADMFSRSSVGNLKERTIEEIWTGNRMKKLRQEMEQRNRFKVPICQDCDIHLSWHNLTDFYDDRGELLPGRIFV